MNRSKPTGILWGYTLTCVFAACWAFILIGEHYRADTQEPGALCGADSGCNDILSSPASVLFETLPVSVPAVPLFALLALCGLLCLRGRLERDRLAALATLCGYAGVLFGGRLLFEMIYGQGKLCWLCLTMDAATLASLLLGAAAHSRGLVAGLKSPSNALKKMTTAGPEMALIPVVLLGSWLIHQITLPAETTHELVVEAQKPVPPSAQTAPDSSKTPGPSTKPSPSSPSSTTAAGAPPKATTRRMVLPEERAEIPLSSDVPTRGPANAPITIVLFEDFQCPFCKKLSGNVELLLDEVGDEVRIAFMHFPMNQRCNERELKKSLHKFACNAAAASVCAAEQDRFWPMHDLLFRNNHRLRNRHLQNYAREAGVDMNKWGACMKAPSTMDKVRADSAIGAKAGVTGTPALFINGRKLVGAQPVEVLMAAVTAERQGETTRIIRDVETSSEVIGDLADASSQVTLEGPDGPFTIDAFEASLDNGVAVSLAGAESARNLSWYEASDACKASGKRLCTEAEWLTACTGQQPIDEDGNGIYSTDILQGRQHAYGEHYREGFCADARKKADPRPLITGNHPRCSTPEGVYDLEGVLKEWIGATPDKAALKGGSYFSRNSARCAYYKDDEAPDTRDASVGFRCCGGNEDVTASGASQRHQGGKVGDRMKTWQGTMVDGNAFSTKSIVGKPLIMTFWASWCEPCKAELPALSELYRKHHGDGLQIVGVNVDQNPQAARSYLAENNLPFPVVLDTDKSIMNGFQTRGVPTTFWVNRAGLIRQRSVGYDEKARPKVERWVQDLLSD